MAGIPQRVQAGKGQDSQEHNGDNRHQRQQPAQRAQDTSVHRPFDLDQRQTQTESHGRRRINEVVGADQFTEALKAQHAE